ncbi:MAG: Membrane-bound metallopeptidase [Fusobacteria bacterium]|nr:MAG: Membrane-bound metallopeptidase [Fusobacteriota bacterium]KAF0228095.1 MAG: Membrane-bound [Fusobacteriota bacterium]
MKKIFRLLFGVLVLSVIILAPSTMVQAGLSDEKAATEKQIEEFKKNITEANGNLEKILAQVNIVENTIREIDAKLVQINQEITVIEGNIVVKQTEIENATIEYNKKKAVFFDNLRSNYEKGGVDYTAVILDSTDLTDFINYNEYFRIIKEKEEEKIREIVAAKQALEVQKQELIQIQETLAVKKADIVAQKKQQSIEQQKLASQKAYFASLASKYKAELAKEQAALAEIDKKIQEALEAQKNSGGGNVVYTGNGVFAWPVPSSNRITSQYGWRSSPIFGGSEFHKGIDISASGGASIVSAESGVVLISYYSSSFGNTVVVNHGSGIMTLYAHMSSRSVSAGQSVSKGQHLGGVGSTGWSTGNHLHFQVTNKSDIYNGAVDPNIYLNYR